MASEKGEEWEKEEEEESRQFSSIILPRRESV
jgi:hypothetical protein